MRFKILELCGQGLISSNWELLSLFLPRTESEQEIIWLVSNFVSYAWESIFNRNSDVKLDKLFGFLTFKYKMDKKFSGVSLGQINGFT